MKHLFVNFFLSTNHIRIGLYLLFGIFAGYILSLLSLLIRMQLTFLNHIFLVKSYHFYYIIVSIDSIIMLFLFILYHMYTTAYIKSFS